MTNDTATLNDMINVLEDSRGFYAEAAEQVDRPDLRTLFLRMATTKRVIMNDLKNKVIFTGEEPADGSWAGSIRKAYAGLKTRLIDDSPGEYVAQLEEFEDRILDQFRDAVEASDDPSVRQIAIKYLPEVQRDHDQMRSLKIAMGRAN